VPKRIQLPSAEELFAPTAKTPEPPAVEVTKPAPRARRAAPRKPAAQRTADHLENLEGRLGELPINTLIDLRDGLEELLIAEDVEQADVDKLLASLAV
jgi:hypothetical protein